MHTANKVIVVKMNPSREETWRYDGYIINRSPHKLLVEAFFNIDEVSLHGITLRRNDRSIECFYDNRWYNIFEIHDQEDDRLKGWYCNITMPAEFTPGKITHVDLALDLLVYPNGDFLVLDRDEFENLALDEKKRSHALSALNRLIELAKAGRIADELN